MNLAQASVPPRASVPDPAHGWSGEQGAQWATRNPTVVAALDAHYLTVYGVERTVLNRWVLEGVPLSATVLEVGCSAGAQLNAMAAVGFTSLEGCDISADALKACPWPNKLADGRALPYADGSFDVVMTSGTLMQIPPGAKGQFVSECYRVAKRWVYGVEGANEGRGRTWEFQGLIPNAWTEHYPETILRPGWRVVRDRWLYHYEGENKVHLRAYLLEREG